MVLSSYILSLGVNEYRVQINATYKNIWGGTSCLKAVISSPNWTCDQENKMSLCANAK